MSWQTINSYRAQFTPPPSRATVLQWARNGMLEKYQPGGKGGIVYVRPLEAANESLTESEQLRRALNGST